MHRTEGGTWEESEVKEDELSTDVHRPVRRQTYYHQTHTQTDAAATAAAADSDQNSSAWHYSDDCLSRRAITSTTSTRK